MAMIHVPRTEIIELLGLSPDVDDATLRAAMEAAIARGKQQEVAAAQANREQTLAAEDRRLVNAAYNDGRIVNRDSWINALAADRTANRALLASLASGLPPTEKIAVDEELDRVHGQVMARLGIPNPPKPPRTVAAASPSPSSAPVDMLGLPLPGVPAPVRIVRGKDPRTWTKQERDDAALWQLGPAFRGRLRPPPGGDGLYYPSPNDPYEYVETSDGQGEWRAKPDYQPRGD